MDTLYCWSCRGRQVSFWLPGSGRVGVLQPLIVVFTLFSTPLGSVNRVQSMVLALLLTLVASALAQPFPRGPDPPGQPNNIFSYAQYKTDNQFTRSGTPLKVCSTAQLTEKTSSLTLENFVSSVFITVSLPYGLAELTGEMMDRYQNAMAQVFASKDFPKTGKADIFVDSITDGYIPTKYDMATRRRLLQVQAVNNVNLATKVRISARK